MESWYDMLKEMMAIDKEDFEAKTCTLDDESLKKEFYTGYGVPEGQPFTAWGKDWVYFPICYDGAEEVGHAPRNPCDISMAHQGGGFETPSE